MPVYTYRAKSGPKEFAEGRIEADTEKEAIEKINRMGYLPIRIEQAKDIPSHKVSKKIMRAAGRIRPRQVTVITRQLASLLRSGVPVLNAIDIIKEQSESPTIKNILNDVHNEVKAGATLSSALARYPQAFPSLYTAMIRTGEDSGALPDVLIKISDYRSKEDEMLSRFRTAMAYPSLMAAVGFATVVFMLTFVLPRLMKIYANMGEALPLPTQILISLSQGLCRWWVWIALGLAVLTFFIRRQARTKAGRVSVSALKLRLPIFGRFLMKSELSRLCRTMEMLIRNGIPILKAIEISVPVVDNEILRRQLRRSCKELEAGGSFGEGLKGSRLFPPFVTNLIIVGERSGRLDDALGEVAAAYERETEEAMKVMSSLLEPLMILVMGLIVGFLVVSMLLPIFEIDIMVK